MLGRCMVVFRSDHRPSAVDLYANVDLRVLEPSSVAGSHLRFHGNRCFASSLLSALVH